MKLWFKKLRYALPAFGFVLLVGSPQLSAAAPAGDPEDDVQLGVVKVVNSEFKAAAEEFLALPLATAEEREGRNAMLVNRIAKQASGARTNTEIEDPSIQDIYNKLQELYRAVREGKVVGTNDRNLLEKLKTRLEEIKLIMPDVSAKSAGEADPDFDSYYESGIDKLFGSQALVIDFPSLGSGLSGKWSDCENKVELYFKEHRELLPAFVKAVQSASNKTQKNSESGINLNRLLAYLLLDAAGYDADDLVPSILKELEECTEGGRTIVNAFNRVLIEIIRPRLLGIKLLEDQSTLDRYFNSLNELARLVRDGENATKSGYQPYRVADGQYTELQRVYSSLQIHVVGLRINAIVPELEKALAADNEEARRLADEKARELELEQRRLKDEQDAQRLASLEHADRKARMQENLTKLIIRRTGELNGRADTPQAIAAAAETQKFAAQALEDIRQLFETAQDQEIAKLEAAYRGTFNKINEACDVTAKALEARKREAVQEDVKKAATVAVEKLATAGATALSPQELAVLPLEQLASVPTEGLSNAQKVVVQKAVHKVEALSKWGNTAANVLAREQKEFERIRADLVNTNKMDLESLPISQRAALDLEVFPTGDPRRAVILEAQRAEGRRRAGEASAMSYGSSSAASSEKSVSPDRVSPTSSSGESPKPVVKIEFTKLKGMGAIPANALIEVLLAKKDDLAKDRVATLNSLVKDKKGFMDNLDRLAVDRYKDVAGILNGQGFSEEWFKAPYNVAFSADVNKICVKLRAILNAK